jgi:hypothetical protein
MTKRPFFLKTINSPISALILTLGVAFGTMSSAQATGGIASANGTSDCGACHGGNTSKSTGRAGISGFCKSKYPAGTGAYSSNYVCTAATAPNPTPVPQPNPTPVPQPNPTPVPGPNPTPVPGPTPDPTACNEPNPGNDPIAGYSQCSGEDTTCTFTGTVDIAYGANGKFNFLRNQSGGSVACNNGTFGDPIYGTYKACYVKNESESVPTLNAASDVSVTAGQQLTLAVTAFDCADREVTIKAKNGLPQGAQITNSFDAQLQLPKAVITWTPAADTKEQTINVTLVATVRSDRGKTVSSPSKTVSIQVLPANNNWNNNNDGDNESHNNNSNNWNNESHNNNSNNWNNEGNKNSNKKSNKNKKKSHDD